MLVRAVPRRSSLCFPNIAGLLSAADAIKILDKNDIKANGMTVNVRREIAIMDALNHKNIVNLREVMSSKSKLYLVMDLARGGELFEMIERTGEFDENLARQYFQQLVDGVFYCHRRGVYHRDLKPKNLLVDERGTLKITDFGVSYMKSGMDGSDLLYTACGTPYYCAPEILNGAEEGYSGAKIDAWSCGVILYLLLTGTLPFQNGDMTQLYEQINRCIIDYPAWMPSEAKDLITHLLRKDPNLRFSLDDVKRHPWFLVDYGSNDVDSGRRSSSADGSFSRGRSRSSSAESRSDEKLIKPVESLALSEGTPKSDARQLPQRHQDSPSSSLAPSASGGGSSQSTTPSSAAAAPIPGNALKDIATRYEGRQVNDLIKDVLPGKPRRKLDVVVSRLEDLDIDSVGDLQFLAETLQSTETLTAWLEDQSKLPSLTCMRIVKVFFA
jgi:serine/threonine protein kinase